MKTLKEIIERLKAIEVELRDSKDLKLESIEALNTEVEELNARKLELEKNQIEETRSAAIENITKGFNDSEIIPKPEERKEEIIDENPLSKTEYRIAWLKNQQRKKLSEVELRTLTTAVGSGGAAVPTTTWNKITRKLYQVSSLYPYINVTNIPGNVSFPVSNAQNDASFKAEGTDGTEADDTLTYVSLVGYELIKLVTMSAALKAMAITEFETYLVDEIGRKFGAAIENTILNGTGSDEPTGIYTGVIFGTQIETYTAGELKYDDLVNTVAKLPKEYRFNAKWCMSTIMYASVIKIKSSDGLPIFVADPTAATDGKVLGFEVVIDDAMPNDVDALFGDFLYYRLNWSMPTEISSDESIGFKSGKTTYRGLAVLDAKPVLNEAFVKCTPAE